jgi:hypothetical protein
MLAKKECEIVNVNVDPNNEMELQDLKLKKPESFTSKDNFEHLLLENVVNRHFSTSLLMKIFLMK